MPIVRIEMLEGRPPELKERLLGSVTEAVAGTLDIPAERVRVLLYELSPRHWAVGGRALDATAAGDEEA